MCGLSAAPKRMESYDISNTGASDIVASMVVYAGARPLKRDYRRFKMKSVTAHPDDYASMEEVLTRRLQRYADGDEKFAPLPDVFLIDGGMTHAAVAEKVCAAFRTAHSHFRHGQGRPPPYTRPHHRRGAMRSTCTPTPPFCPHRANSGGNAPLRHHLPPREPHALVRRLRARRYPQHRRGAQAEAAGSLQERQGHPRGGAARPAIGLARRRAVYDHFHPQGGNAMTGKLYGTLGPACADTDTLRALLRAGMRGVRLNLSHGPLAERAPWLESLRRAETAEGVSCELLIDLQGPELRVGAFSRR